MGCKDFLLPAKKIPSRDWYEDVAGLVGRCGGDWYEGVKGIGMRVWQDWYEGVVGISMRMC